MTGFFNFVGFPKQSNLPAYWILRRIGYFGQGMKVYDIGCEGCFGHFEKKGGLGILKDIYEPFKGIKLCRYM